MRSDYPALQAIPKRKKPCLRVNIDDETVWLFTDTDVAVCVHPGTVKRGYSIGAVVRGWNPDDGKFREAAPVTIYP